MILVVGATSHPGMKLVPMLLAKGYPVRAFTRTPHKAQPLQELGAEVFQGDLRQPETVRKACQGAEWVISSVCAPINEGDNNIHTVDERGNRTLIDAAKAAGVKHFVFISAYGVSNDYPVDFFRIKFLTEEYLKASGLRYTILRATMFMDVWGNMIGGPALAGKRVILFGDGKKPANFIAAEDVAKFIVIALEDPRMQDKVVDIGGPQNFTLDEVAELYGRVAGRQVRKTHLPYAAMRLISKILWPIQEGPARLMAMAASIETSPLELDMTTTVQRYPINLICLEEFAAGAVRDGIKGEEKR